MTFFSIVLCTNMAAVTSGENHLLIQILVVRYLSHLQTAKQCLRCYAFQISVARQQLVDYQHNPCSRREIVPRDSIQQGLNTTSPYYFPLSGSNFSSLLNSFLTVPTERLLNTRMLHCGDDFVPKWSQSKLLGGIQAAPCYLVTFKHS